MSIRDVIISRMARMYDLYANDPNGSWLAEDYQSKEDMIADILTLSDEHLATEYESFCRNGKLHELVQGGYLSTR